MRTNFGAEVTQVADLTSNVASQAGVAKAPVTLNALNDIFSGVGEVLAGRKEGQSERIVADFTAQQLLVADALDQGRIKNSAHAQTLLRKNLLDAYEANPTLIGEFISAQSAITGLAGAAKIVNEGDEQEQLHRRRTNSLIDAGLLPEQHTESQRQEAADKFVTAKRASEQYDLTLKDIQLKRAAIGLTTAQRSELEAQEKNAANTFVRDSLPAEFDLVRNEFRRIISSDATPADKSRAIREYYTEWQSQVTSKLGNVPSELKDSLSGVFDRLESDYLDFANGTLEQADLDNSVKKYEAQAKALILADPQTAKLAAASSIFGGDAFMKLVLGSANSTQILKTFDYLAGFSDDSTTEAPKLFTSDSASKRALEVVLPDLTNSITNDTGEKKEESVTTLNKVLEQLEDEAGVIARNPEKAIKIIEWLSSPSFLKAVQTNPDVFSNIDGLKEVLQTHYHDEVSGLIDQQFNEAGVTIFTGGSARSARVRNVKDVIRAVPNASGVNFVAIDPDSASAVKRAAELNKTLKPIINNSVRASAHLSGRTDYQKVWEETSEQIFGAQGEDGLAGGDAGDDLTLDSFNTQVNAKVDALPTPVQDDTEFLGEVSNLASELEIPTAALLAVMDFETGGSFDPAQKNAAGSSGTGLIQFMGKTAEGLGTSTANLANMSRTEQMSWVRKYFDPYKDKIRGGDVSDVYMAVLYPAAIGKPDNHVLFREGTLAYTQNKGLDKSGDGTVTKAEAAAKVVNLVGKYK